MDGEHALERYRSLPFSDSSWLSHAFRRRPSHSPGTLQTDASCLIRHFIRHAAIGRVRTESLSAIHEMKPALTLERHGCHALIVLVFSALLLHMCKIGLRSQSAAYSGLLHLCAEHEHWAPERHVFASHSSDKPMYH